METKASVWLRALKAAVLFARAGRPAHEAAGGRWKPGVRRTTPSGTAYDLYDSPGAKKTFVAIHGMTVAGERDPRLVRLSRLLSESGVRTAAVALPGLKALELTPKDLQPITGAASALAAEYGGPVGVVAFSFGAGMALAAGAKSAAGTIDPIIAFGAYHSLAGVLEHLDGDFRKMPKDDVWWDDFVYARAVQVIQSAEAIGLDDATRGEILSFLAAYCCEPSVKKKRAFNDRILERLPGLPGRVVDPAAAEELSPAGKLLALSARVILFHDSSDRLIPPSHSERLFAELRARPAGSQDMLITPVLSHVNPGDVRRAGDLLRFVTLAGELYA